MKKYITLLLALATTIFSGCEKLIGDNDDNGSGKPGVSTLDVTDIDASSATFNGKLTRPAQIGEDFDFGFEVSVSKGFEKDSTTSYSVDIISGDDNTFYYVAKYCLKPAHTYYVRAYMFNLKSLYLGNIKSFSTLELEYICVDLGLSVKWATFNVGANNPVEYGDYFAWGEIQPKSDYSWSSYKYCNGSSSSITKYCTDSRYGTVDNKITLELSDDAAHANWGGSWRMPTITEFEELFDNCTWTWTTQNGVNGYKVTSNKAGYTDKSIFLPAAGYRDNDNLYSAGSGGDFWSSSLSMYYSDFAYELIFNSSDLNRGNIDRYYGHSVRPVCP